MTFWHRNLFNLTPNLTSLSNFGSKYMYNADIMVSIQDLTFWWPLYDLKWPWSTFLWILRKKCRRLMCISYRQWCSLFISRIFDQLDEILAFSTFLGSIFDPKWSWYAQIMNRQKIWNRLIGNLPMLGQFRMIKASGTKKSQELKDWVISHDSYVEMTHTIHFWNRHQISVLMIPISRGRRAQNFIFRNWLEKSICS